jgi:hypothetical protein
MTLDDFLAETRAEIATQMSEGSPFAELVFCEVVMQHLVDVGMTFEPVICHYQGKVGNANLRLSGYAISDGPAKLIASMTGTMMVVRGREDIAE